MRSVWNSLRRQHADESLHSDGNCRRPLSARRLRQSIVSGVVIDVVGVAVFAAEARDSSSVRRRLRRCTAVGLRHCHINTDSRW